jgi:protein O-mannosyl-transferase
MKAKQNIEKKASRKTVKQNPNNPEKFILPAILLITAIVFSNTLSNSFIENFDDQRYVLNNPLIKHLGWDNLKAIFSTFCIGNYHPLTILSYAVEYKFAGLNPFVFHLTNYILHLLNTLLVYLFLKRFTGQFWVAVIASMFFGIHPMHVESVAWISERKDVLYTFFFLLSLICYSNYLIKGKKISYLIWAFIWFFMSLMSKPAAVCLPLVLILMDWYHYKGTKKNSSPNMTSGIMPIRQSLIAKIPFLAFALLFGAITIFSQRTAQSFKDITPVFSIFDRIFLVSYSTVFYLFKAFVPFNLSALHYYPVKSGSLLPVEYYFALPVLLVLVWAVFKIAYSTRPVFKSFSKELIFGLLFYFITIALELQLIPVGQTIVSERYSYVPYIGIFFIGGQFFSYMKNHIYNQNRVLGITFNTKQFTKLISFVLVIFLVLFSFLTWQRSGVWKNGKVLMADVVRQYPQNGFGWFSLGYSEMQEKNLDGAIVNFDKAIELEPNFTDALIDCGICENGKRDFDAAIKDYSRVIEFNPTFTDAYNNRGIVEYEQKNFSAATADYNKTLELDPTYVKAYLNRGIVESKTKDYQTAIKDYSKVIDLDPTYNNAYYYRGFANFYLHDTDAACRDWQSALQYGNENAAALLKEHCK